MQHFLSSLSSNITNGTRHDELSPELQYKLDVIHAVAVGVAAIFMLASVALSLAHMILHLLNYTKPSHQRYIMRILFMVPVYVVNSWISLLTKRQHWFMFFDLVRDCYEAYMIYIFFKYCVVILGGLEATEILMSLKHKHGCTVPFCCIKFKPDRTFYRRCLQGCIQYVILKPLMTGLSIVLYAFGKFEEGDFSPTGGYLYVSIVNNCSVMIALYALATFYETMAVELGPHKPLLKFLCIKGVIFFTYWQSVCIAALVYLGVFGNEPEVKKFVMDLVNDGLVCTEMLIAAIALFFAFTYKNYVVDMDDELVANKSSFQKLMFRLRRLKPDKKSLWKTREVTASVIHATNQVDVLEDTVYSVNPLADRKTKTKETEELVEDTFHQLGDDEISGEAQLKRRQSLTNLSNGHSTPVIGSPTCNESKIVIPAHADEIHLITIERIESAKLEVKQPDFSVDFENAEISESRPLTQDEQLALQERSLPKPDPVLESYKLRPPKKLIRLSEKLKQLTRKKPKYSHLNKEEEQEGEEQEESASTLPLSEEELLRQFELFKQQKRAKIQEQTLKDEADKNEDVKLGFEDSFHMEDEDAMIEEFEIELVPRILTQQQSPFSTASSTEHPVTIPQPVTSDHRIQINLVPTEEEIIVQLDTVGHQQ